ncbi:hypothetical protein [Aporhodopirellula aestuarii]|uniref:Uncharacterized protein n=1 Tax=Aporhodopirellula aestuarii TaxID=2950107 RepID=A0ABT0U3A5_9BACT|nr:hypothetical protein [Aporhodopirellula aestuarii]MCM2371286.1 hypothetical protein [Aporhodopirellula aestuarii]
MSTASDDRLSLRQRGFWLVGAFVLAALAPSDRVSAQNGFSPTPLTNLAPIGPSGSGNVYPPSNSGSIYGANPAGASVSGSLSPTTPSFDPYATSGGATLGGSGFNFAPPGFGGSTVTPLGTPTPTGAPSYSVGPSVGPNPSYPNGSLLGGLFSGNWFRSNSGTGLYQGAGYPSATAAPYNAPSVYGSPPAYGAAPMGSGSLYGNGPILSPSSPSGYGGDPFPASAYPSGSPTSLFPSGLGGPGYGGTLLPAGLFSAGGFNAYQLLHGPRLRHSFIGGGGDDQDDLGINQTDVSLGFAFGNFFYSNRPLYVVPSFSLYLFDGPMTTASNNADLPGSAYGGFLDFGWQSDPNQIIGSELGFRVGAFSDFDTFNSDSVRFMGKGLVSFRLTPASTLKAGVYYLDRESIKMLPAGGLLWQPDPYTRFDIFFPEPKLAKYWRTIGTQDVWWYLAGEYGGDSWTVTRNFTNIEERVDVNQIAVTFGWEWGRSDLIRAGQRTAFIEFGGVFQRELKYEFSPDDQDLGEAFIVRAGYGY